MFDKLSSVSEEIWRERSVSGSSYNDNDCPPASVRRLSWANKSYSVGDLAENVSFFLHSDQFVSVELLRPTQPIGVMSSAVSLPNHTFTTQAYSSKQLTSIVHILSSETDNYPS